MGVKGLTTYIAANAKKYLTPFELHDTDLIIDGDNLASMLMKNHENGAFGGDYDSYYEYVRRFFALMKRCNVNCYVLLDGGYQPSKLRTVKTRLHQKICAIRNINPTSPNHSYFPLMFREVFISALKDAGVKYMRCLFEADNEIAVLAKHLDCPVLSYDSDFYIYNVKYIPSVTLTYKAYKKVVSQTRPDQVYTERLTLKGKKRQRKNLKPALDIDADQFEVEEEDEAGECYYFMDCSLYELSNLIEADRIDPALVSYLPAILGNDHISFFRLTSFISKFNKQRTKKNKRLTRKMPTRQLRVDNVFAGLKNESVASVKAKLSATVRSQFIDKMENVADSYHLEPGQSGISFMYFGLEEVEGKSEEEEESEEESDARSSSACSEEEVDEDTLGDEEQVDEEEELENLMENLEITEERKTKLNPEKKQFVEHPEDIQQWFVDKYLTGVLPRFCMDMVNLKMYINSPQIENFQMEDANVAAHRIIVLIFSLLHDGRKDCELYYLTRKTGAKLVTYKTIKSMPLNQPFEPEEPKNLVFFKDLFQKFPNRDRIFEMVDSCCPPDYRLYFLGIIYWSKYSQLFNMNYAKALLVAFLTLTLLDKKCGVVRREIEFNRTFAKDLERIKKEVVQQAEKQKPINLENYFEEKSERLLRKKVTKQECVVLLERLIPFLSQNNLHHKKHQPFSTSILHGFAQFQSILQHLSTLNELCNRPFPPLQMEQVYKGFLLYNLYCSFHKRTDGDYYAQKVLFKGLKNAWNYYEYLYKWTEELVFVRTTVK